MNVTTTIRNLKNGKATECCAEITGMGRVISLSLSNDEFYQSPNEYRGLIKVLKECIEEDLQEYDKFLLKNPDLFAMERQYIWNPSYYGKNYMNGQIQTVSLHTLFGGKHNDAIEKIVRILCG